MANPYRVSFTTEGLKFLSAIQNGSEKYTIKDAEARKFILSNAVEISSIWDTVKGGVHFRGTTTTALADKATTNPVKINGEDYTAEAGDIVICTDTVDREGNIEFVFDGTNWQRLGSFDGLGNWAWWNAGAVSGTPAGTVSVDTKASVTSAITDTKFTGTATKPTGKVTIDGQSLSAGFTGTTATLSTVFQGTQATISANVTGLCALSVTPTFSGGTDTITAEFSCTNGYAATDLEFQNVSQLSVKPTFTGTEQTAHVTFFNKANLSGKAELGGLGFNSTVTYKPEGSASATYTPAGSVSASYTPSGSVSASYTPSGSVSASYTPSGSVSISYTPVVSVNTPDIMVGLSTETACSSTSYANEVLTLNFGQFITDLEAECKQDLTAVGTAATLTAALAGTAATINSTFKGTTTTINSTFTGRTATIDSTFTGTSATIQSTFTGTEKTLTATGSFAAGTEANVGIAGSNLNGALSGTVTFTPGGTVSTITYTPTGKVVLPAYKPTGNVTGTVTPTGTISTIEYTPAGGKVSTTYRPSGTVDDISYTPAGTIAVESFSQKEYTLAMDDYTPTGTISAHYVIPGHTHTAKFTGELATWNVWKVS